MPNTDGGNGPDDVASAIVTRRMDEPADAESSNEVLAMLVERGRSRVRVLAGLGAGTFALGALIAAVVPPVIGRPASSSTVFLVLCLALTVVSFGVFHLVGHRLMKGWRVIVLGLGYVVLSSISMAAAEVALASPGMEYSGIPGLCVWIVLFPLVVPSLPLPSALTAVLSALSLPAAYGVSRLAGAPALPDQVLAIWIAAPLFCAGIATAGAITVHRFAGELVAVRRAMRELGSYRLERRLGRGGMGDVWLAHHRLLPRSAAIKLVRPLARRADLAQHFEREAHAIARLRSPHTVQLYDYGVAADGRLYYAMELLDGCDLDALVRRHGPQPPARVASILGQACLSLMEAHAQGLVHRDCSTRNLMLCRVGIAVDVVKVLDFGLVAALTGAEPGSQAGGSGVAGTPGFIAPEVLAGSPADARSDLYALGVIGWWLLTGRLPTTPGEETAPRHPDLEGLLIALCSPDPSRRPADAAALRSALLALAFTEPWGEHEAQEWWQANAPTKV